MCGERPRSPSKRRLQERLNCDRFTPNTGRAGDPGTSLEFTTHVAAVMCWGLTTVGVAVALPV